VRTFTAMAGLDQIEALYLEGVIDGIHLTPPDMEEGLKAFAETMLPALIARGLVLAGEPAGTLRARLGIA
jgi:alkanesulfonate monooxygenase SsuD/methylene tetrahydromethanopterin reductase-like flavin-dependent oxidoreductase (luciferase family)